MLFQYVTKLNEVYCTILKIDSVSNLSATDILKASSFNKKRETDKKYETGYTKIETTMK